MNSAYAACNRHAIAHRGQSLHPNPLWPQMGISVSVDDGGSRGLPCSHAAQPKRVNPGVRATKVRPQAALAMPIQGVSALRKNHENPLQAHARQTKVQSQQTARQE